MVIFLFSFDFAGRQSTFIWDFHLALCLLHKCPLELFWAYLFFFRPHLDIFIINLLENHCGLRLILVYILFFWRNFIAIIIRILIILRFFLCLLLLNRNGMVECEKFFYLKIIVLVVISILIIHIRKWSLSIWWFVVYLSEESSFI